MHKNTVPCVTTFILQDNSLVINDLNFSFNIIYLLNLLKYFYSHSETFVFQSIVLYLTILLLILLLCNSMSPRHNA